jgi:hypothetical protein
MSGRAPNVPARMTFLALLCAGSSWGIHALGLRWLWAAPLGLVAGVVLYVVWLILDSRHRHGCCEPPPFPRDVDTPSIPVPRVRPDEPKS